MTRSRIVHLSLVLILLATAGLLLARWRSSAFQQTSDYPEGSLWICGAAACREEFAVSLPDLARHYEEYHGEPPKCPQCGSAECVRALRCPNCRRQLTQE